MVNATFETEEEFWADDDRRRRSPEVDFGNFWTEDDERFPFHRISWLEHTGEVYVIRLSPGGRGQVEVLGVAATRADALAALNGWATLPRMHLSWARERLAGAGAAA